MENLQVFLDQMRIEMAKQTNDILSQIDEKLMPLTKEIADLKQENQTLKNKISNLENDKINNNLVIYELKEDEKSPSDLLVLIIKKIKTCLNIEIEERDINNIYRIGKKNNESNKTRPILMKLVNNWKKNEILRNKKKFKDIYVSEEYTKEVLIKRRQLLPKLQEERSKGNFAILKQDRLVIKEGNSFLEKRKRAESTSPEISIQPRKQYATSKANRINAFDVMRVRSNSLSSGASTSERNK